MQASLSLLLVVLFGLFINSVGLLMMFVPSKAHAILNKAASSPKIHFAELILRCIPAVALLDQAAYARSPFAFQLLGFVMLTTSLILIILPRKWHYAYAQKAAEILQPRFIPWLAPLAFIFGGLVLYNVL